MNEIFEEYSFLRIGTDVGLSRLNKNNGTVYWWDKSNAPFIDAEILNIVIDDKHNKWIGTTSGLFKFNEGKWECVDRDALDIGSNCINCLNIESQVVESIFVVLNSMLL